MKLYEQKTSVTIIGHFGGDEQLNDGQTVKTIALYNELKRATDWDIRITVHDPDTYLKNLYGDDYMQEPPKNKRERHFIKKIDFGNR